MFTENIYEFLQVVINQLNIARTDIYFFWTQWIDKNK